MLAKSALTVSSHWPENHMTPVTYLFVPASRPDRIAKAFATGAHAVIVDLEDAIDAADKTKAREQLGAFLMTSVHSIWIRVNAVSTPWFDDDRALARKHAHKISGVMLAKTESAQDIDKVNEASATSPLLPVITLVESAAGVLALAIICAHPQVARIAFGSADLARDLGCEDAWETLQFARAQVILHSASCQLPSPIDGVTFALDNPDIVQQDAARAARHGFGAKLCIHPSQLKPTLQGFAPTAQQLQWATDILAAAAGAGAQRLHGQMIDRPVIERASQILQRHASLRSESVT
jgi:citrate lyase subunit beta/citryl-CoA lyase